MEIYVVRQGDSIYRIAQRFGVSPVRLAYDNQIAGQEHLVPGQALLILIPEVVHTVEMGERVEQVAENYGITAKELYRRNPFLLGQNYLMAGQQLVIRYEGEKAQTQKISGYVYTYVAGYILREALLYIHDMLVFSYGFTMQGELVPPQANDEWLIREAKRFQVRPILVLTPFSQNGTFNNMLVKEVVKNKEMQEQLIGNLLEMVEEKGYAGVDVDFEFILPENREGYTEFVSNLRNAMNEAGYTVSAALAPKISAEQRGIIYEGMDYRMLGEAADEVFLMTYEWGYTYGPPMAVAPVNKVREVLDYAVAEIAREKIMMGIPNYGYDWPLPFEQGVTKAKTIGNVEAVRIASQNGAEIAFDETAQSPFFRYWTEGKQHEVWFEDVRSIRAKGKMAEEYGLRGFGYWNLMRMFRANWMLISSSL